MKHSNKDLDYKKFIHIFNTEGKKAAKEFVLSTTSFNYDYYIKLLKKYTGYVYNRQMKRYEQPSNESDAFISIDDLLSKGKNDATPIVASIPEKLYCKNPIDALNIDLLQDRLMELSKYIKIAPSAKTIEINIISLRESGYDVSMIN